MRYATKQIFGGQQARVGDIVVVSDTEIDEGGTSTGRLVLRMGIIDSINETTDEPMIRVFGPSGATGNGWYFVPTCSAAQIEAMSEGSWTWQPRQYGLPL
jgi:hypothetical protein